MPMTIDEYLELGKDSVLHNALVGKTLSELRIEPGEGHLAIVTTSGEYVLEAWGDCCSETWFADITGVSLAIGAVVQSVETMILPEPNDGRSRQEYDRAYGIRIATGGGVLDVAYRNSSNGYYGGECVLMKEPLDSSDWKRITEDWSA